MIPKKIHYCWFGGGEQDEKTKACIASWKKYLTDYEIIEWNENNFDVNINQFVSEAYNAKKWAFVSDYARLWVLMKYGGIYLDADVEVLKPFDNLLDLPAFTCYESTLYDEKPTIEAGIIGSEKDGKWVSDMITVFDGEKFLLGEDESGEPQYNLKILPSRLMEKTEALYNSEPKKNNLTLTENEITIFDFHYFSPKLPKKDTIEITKDTYAIHHFNNSWVSPYAYHKLRRKYYRKFGRKFGTFLFVIVHPFKAIRAYKYLKHGK